MLFEATDVSFQRGSRVILDGISLSIAAGEAVALTGPNGSGKTTFIRLSTGYLRSQAGRIEVLGATKLGPKRRSKIGVVWQDRGLPLSVSSKRWVNHLSSLYSTEVDRELLERLDVPVSKTPMRYLSGGEQQRLAIYGAMAHSPKLLILDEPTVGLDDQSRSTLYSILRERMRSGAGILFTSHYAQDVAVLAHRFVSLQGEAAQSVTAALFTVDGTLDLFATAALLPQGYQLLSTTNGYRIKGDDPTQLLPIANQLAASQSLNVLSFAVVSNG